MVYKLIPEQSENLANYGSVILTLSESRLPINVHVYPIFGHMLTFLSRIFVENK